MEATTPNRRILSGMRSSNPKLHIGNYEGALRNWVELQNDGYDMFCMVADYHALTTMAAEAGEVSRNAREVAKDYIAAGIDPQKSVVFVQSHVPEHAELHVLFSMITPLGWLERTPTYKEKVEDLMAEASQRVIALVADLETAARETIKQSDLEPGLHQTLAGIVGLIGTLALDDVNSYLYGCRSIIALWEKGGDQQLSNVAESVEQLSQTLSQLTVTVPYGLLGYPVLQTADILLYRPLGVPVGKDQAPHLEIGNDIGRRFNHLYDTEVFTPYKYMISQDESRAKLPGLDMRKMSKSYDNCINMADTEDETAAKIKSAFTTPTKIKLTDPGVPEGCAVCQYLKIYSPDWQRQWAEDVAGERGCMQNKRELTEAINEYFRPMRERRAALDDATIEEILRDGAERARAVASETMAAVRGAMGMF